MPRSPNSHWWCKGVHVGSRKNDVADRYIPCPNYTARLFQSGFRTGSVFVLMDTSPLNRLRKKIMEFARSHVNREGGIFRGHDTLC